MKQIKRNVALALTLVLTVACMWSEGLTAIAAPVFSVPVPNVTWKTIDEIAISTEAITVSSSDEILQDELVVILLDNNGEFVLANVDPLNGKSRSKSLNWTEYINESGMYTILVDHYASVSGSDGELKDYKRATLDF